MERSDTEGGERRGEGPGTPLLVYDGTCHFCKRWIARWQRVTGDEVRYAPSQEIASSVPDIPPAAFAEAVHLLEPDGRRSRGAEAVFRALAYAPKRRAWLWAYEHVPGFKAVSEGLYRLVAGHRPFFSRVTDALWGAHVVPPGQETTCWVYVRLIAIVYAIAFASLWVQVDGLVGSDGILPVSQTLTALASSPTLGPARYWVAPTLCWLSSADWFLAALCGGGVALSAALFLGVAPAACLIGLWAAYLSLATVCREFLWFQWDGLLLEAGFLAIFLAPWRLGSRPRSDPPVSRGALRLTRWLLFRLLFASAAVKLLSGDSSWRDLTALRYHFETQPLPTWMGWYAHQLPLGFQRLSTGVTLAVEGLVPFLLFAPRRIRFGASAVIVAHQLVIAATGNYGFFNLLTIALCIPLLDDAVWHASFWRGSNVSLETREDRVSTGDIAPPHRSRTTWIRGTVLTALFLLSLVPLFHAVRAPLAWLGPLPSAYDLAAPLRTVNSYGLFAVMTKERPEIRIEGSNDGVIWSAYPFRFKPGDPGRRPGFVAPHQPRLDWQMWFAAISGFRSEFWFAKLCERLLQGSRPVLNMLRTNPFPGAPPRYLRALVDRYHFTSAAERRRTGAWWRAEPLGFYAPVMTLESGHLALAPLELQPK